MEKWLILGVGNIKFEDIFQLLSQVAIKVLNLYLFLYSNTTKEMSFIFKRDEFSLFYVKRISPIGFIVCTFSVVKIFFT